VEVTEEQAKVGDVEDEESEEELRLEGLNCEGQTREQSEDCSLNFAGLIY